MIGQGRSPIDRLPFVENMEFGPLNSQIGARPKQNMIDVVVRG